METEPARKMFTVDAANRLLPAVRERLAKLRALQRTILTLQGRSDIEELTGADGSGGLTPEAKSRLTELERPLQEAAEGFEEALGEFSALGCELKDLDRGLVDFYSLRDGRIVYLCWLDGEDRITFWHPLEGGFAAREPL